MKKKSRGTQGAGNMHFVMWILEMQPFLTVTEKKRKREREVREQEQSGERE